MINPGTQADLISKWLPKNISYFSNDVKYKKFQGYKYNKSNLMGCGQEFR